MIKREITIFLVVGSLTVLIDFLGYRSLLALNLLSIDFAKGTGFLLGTIFAYCANRFWTFGHQKHQNSSIWRFMLLYVATLGTNVVINRIVLEWIGNATFHIQVAFLAATAVSACLNFIGMKWFVFRVKE